MSLGVQEFVFIIVILLLLFGPAIVLAWGGYILGRRKGREEGAAEARAQMGGPETPAAREAEDADAESAEDAEEDTDE